MPCHDAAKATVSNFPVYVVAGLMAASFDFPPVFRSIALSSPLGNNPVSVSARLTTGGLIIPGFPWPKRQDI